MKGVDGRDEPGHDEGRGVLTHKSKGVKKT